MSTSGLTNEYNPPTLDGLTVIEADQVYIGGQEVNINNLVPYTGATQTVDLGSQSIRTTNTATTNYELVNLGLLNTTISNLSVAIAGTFLDKVTTTPQTVIGNVSYTAQLSADDLLVPTTKKASLGSVLTVDANWRRSETDATVSTVQYFGSITNSLGIYQATTTQNYAILQLADLGVAGMGKRMDIIMNWNINEPSYNSSIQLFASDNGTTLNQYLGPSVSFTPADPLYKVMTGTFVPAYRYICVLCITAKPSGVQTVRWYGLQLEEQGVDITALTMSAQGANQIPIINDKKQLVGSGVSSTKVIYLDNVSSDIQTQLNGKLNLSGSNANQNIILGGYKVQSTATPTVADDLTRKGYVDSAIAAAGASYVLKAGDTATGTIYNSAGDFHPYRGGDTNRGVILTANDADGATYATNNGGLASWFGISFRSTFDNTTRYIFNTRDGNSSQTGKHTVNALNIDGQTASRVAILDGSKNLVSSSVTTTTLGYLDATSSIQGQLNTLSGTFANYLPLTGGTISGDLVVNGANGIGLGSTAVTSGYGGPRYYLSGRGDNQDDVGNDNKWGPWYGLGASGVQGFTGVPCLAGYFGLALRTGSGFMIMNDSGNVGIGTTSVLGRCHIAYAGGNEFLLLNNTNYTTGDYINQQFKFGSSGTVRSAFIQGFLTTNNETDLKFFNANSGGTVAERMIIKGNGTVGIGTATPDTTLNVWGNFKVYDGQIGAPANGINGSTGTRLILWPGGASATPYAFGINNGTLWYGVPATAVHKWYSGLDNTMTLDGSGNLTAAGGVTCGGNLQCNGGTIIFPNRGDCRIYNGSADAYNPTSTANNLIIKSWWGIGYQSYDGAVRIAMDTRTGNGYYAGFVGIGTTDPNHTLDVQRDARTGAHPSGYALYVTRLTGGDADPIAQFRHSNGTQGISIGYNTISASGGNANQPLQLAARGNESINLLNYTRVSGSIRIASGGTYEPGCIYSDANWGMLFRGAVTPNLAHFRWDSSAGTELMRIATSGNVGIGTDTPTGKLDIYNGSTDYTNSVVVRTPWSSVTLDNSAFGGRKWSVLAGGSGAGVGQGGFGIFDITGSAYRLGISTGGVITLYGDAVTTGNQYLNTVNQPSQTTFNNTNNRLLFRDPGTGLTTTGACSTWYYINGGIAWTYGVNIDYAFYVPNTTCSIQINVTGSGYSGNVIGTYLLMNVYQMGTGSYVGNAKAYFFNVTYNHTEITAHFTIGANAWGAQTIGWKRIELSWLYNSGGSISSDSNDSLNWTALVIG